MDTNARQSIASKKAPDTEYTAGESSLCSSNTSGHSIETMAVVSQRSSSQIPTTDGTISSSIIADSSGRSVPGPVCETLPSSEMGGLNTSLGKHMLSTCSSGMSSENRADGEGKERNP